TWDFWLLCNDYDDYVNAQAHQQGRPAGMVLQTDKPLNVRVWVKTWAEVLNENRARLRFIESQLGYSPDHQQALEALKQRFASLFTGGDVDSAADAATEDDDDEGEDASREH